MNRAETLLLAAAKRAENFQDPIDGNFLREHNVSSDELGELMQLVSVALAAAAVARDVDNDLHSQLLLVGAGGLAEVPADISRFALDNVRLSQLQKKLGKTRLKPRP